MYEWITALLVLYILAEICGYCIPEGKMRRFVSILFGVLVLAVTAEMLFFSGKMPDLSPVFKEETLGQESYSYEDFVSGVYERKGVNIYEEDQ